MVIEAFDKSLYATIEDNIFALEEIPEVQTYSKNFDEILPTKPKKTYIPKMTHPFKRDSFEKFIEKQVLKFQKELENVLKILGHFLKSLTVSVLDILRIVILV